MKLIDKDPQKIINNVILNCGTLSNGNSGSEVLLSASPITEGFGKNKTAARKTVSITTPIKKNGSRKPPISNRKPPMTGLK